MSHFVTNFANLCDPDIGPDTTGPGQPGTARVCVHRPDVCIILYKIYNHPPAAAAHLHHYHQFTMDHKLM